ncbi:MAG: elongation factor P [Candidatus Eisenbacteria bacterium]|nr:elongation factor P [Candidatus Eisenbacteria bacterium]
MATSNDFYNGMVIRKDGKLYSIVEFLHVKPGKGSAFVRSKLKEIKTGKVLDVTWRAGEKVDDVRLERSKVQFLYRDDFFHFMKMDTFEQLDLPPETVGDNAAYLKENLEVEMLFEGAEPIIIELPTHVELAVKKTDPGVKGDTVSGGTKPATMETGAVIQVPLFIEEGDVLRIDTRTGEYVSRV